MTKLLLLVTVAALCAMVSAAPEMSLRTRLEALEEALLNQDERETIDIQEEAALLQGSTYTYRVKANTGQVISIPAKQINSNFVCLEYHGTLPLGGCVTPGGCDTWRSTGVKLCYDDYKYIKKPCIGSFGGKDVQAQRSSC